MEGRAEQRRRSALGLAAILCGALAAGPAAPARAADDPVAGTVDLLRLTATSEAGGTDERFLVADGPPREVAAVAFVGDAGGPLTSSGAEDFAFGMPTAGAVGHVAVVFGPRVEDAPAPGFADLGRLGERGFTLVGEPGPSEAGRALAGGCDVNGDGLDELLVGAPGTAVAGRGGTGVAYVVFGGPRPASGSLRLSELGSRGVRISGASAGDRTGASVGTIGDLDGDGRCELLVGAPAADGPGGRTDAGAVYVLYSSGLQGEVDLAALGDRGYRIDGPAASDAAGTAVASVGDMSGDGRPEVLVGAPGARGGSGAAHAVWGIPRSRAQSVDLATPGYGFSIAGTGGERAGASVTGLDAVGRAPHIAVGAPRATAATPTDARSAAGAVYVVRGRASTAPLTLPADGLTFAGGGAGEGLGIALAPAGDADGDGSADLLAGLAADRPLSRPAAGSALVLLTGRATPPRVDTGLLGAAGIRLAGPVEGAQTGRALAGRAAPAGKGRPSALIGHRRAVETRGGASLLRLPELPPAPVPPSDARGRANVEVVVDDSGIGGDPDATLRRGALELLLAASDDRIVGAVEFGVAAHQIVPPMRQASGVPLAGDRLEVLRGLLAERIADNAGGPASLKAGLAAADASNLGADARILVVGGAVQVDVEDLGEVATFVLALGSATAATRRLERLALATGGALYQLDSADAVAPAIAAVGARLRGERELETAVTGGAEPEELELGTVTPTPAVAEVAGAGRTVRFESELPLAARGMRLALTWDQPDGFELVDLRVLRRGRRAIVITARQVRRALDRSKAVRGSGGIGISARRGDTFLTVELSGLPALAGPAGEPLASAAAKRPRRRPKLTTRVRSARPTRPLPVGSKRPRRRGEPQRASAAAKRPRRRRSVSAQASRG